MGFFENIAGSFDDTLSDVASSLANSALDSFKGSLADQYKEIITASEFDEFAALVPGVLKTTNNGRGQNVDGSENVISNGSKIFVPENTVACIFGQGGLESVVTEPGAFVYRNGEESIFANPDFGKMLNETLDRVGFGGISSQEKRVCFVNLREIRGIPFGTRGPQVYHDMSYGVDLEVYAFGTFSLKIVDPVLFIKNFVPANQQFYSFASKGARKILLSEFVQSFIVALNSLSDTYRVSQLPSQAAEIARRITSDTSNAGVWRERFGFEVVKIGIETIELSDDSRELIKQFSSRRMNVQAYEGASAMASNMAAQQQIAHGIETNGLGDGGGMLFGMNIAQGISSTGALGSTTSVAAAPPEPKAQSTLSLDQQLETISKLKALLDQGLLTQEEFTAKKKEVLGL